MHLSPILCPHGQPQQRACLFPPFVIMLSVLSLHLSIHIRKYNSFSNFCIVQLCVENSYKTNIKCTGMHYLSFIPFFACRGLVLHFFFLLSIGNLFDSAATSFVYNMNSTIWWFYSMKCIFQTFFAIFDRQYNAQQQKWFHVCHYSPLTGLVSVWYQFFAWE